MSYLIEEAITDQYGERCEEYAQGCPCCDAWKQYDRLKRYEFHLRNRDNWIVESGNWNNFVKSLKNIK